MVDGPPGDVALTERLEQLREHRVRWRSAQLSCDESTWSTVDEHVQVLTSDGTVLYAVRRPGRYQLDVRTPPRARATTGVGSYCLSLEVGQESHIEAIDVSQKLLVISEAIYDTW